MSTEDELAHLRRLNRELIELLESRGINWLAELDPIINTQLDQAANFTTTAPATSETPSSLTTNQKITLFRKLFRGRNDV
jgi:hypothetical protein